MLARPPDMCNVQKLDLSTTAVLHTSRKILLPKEVMVLQVKTRGLGPTASPKPTPPRSLSRRSPSPPASSTSSSADPPSMPPTPTPSPSPPPQKEDQQQHNSTPRSSSSSSSTTTKATTLPASKSYVHSCELDLPYPLFVSTSATGIAAHSPFFSTPTHTPRRPSKDPSRK